MKHTTKIPESWETTSTIAKACIKDSSLHLELWPIFERRVTQKSKSNESHSAGLKVAAEKIWWGLEYRYTGIMREASDYVIEVQWKIMMIFLRCVAVSVYWVEKEPAGEVKTPNIIRDFEEYSLIIGVEVGSFLLRRDKETEN